MIAEKIFIRENGDKVRIIAKYYHYNNTYNIDIQICEKGKRKFIHKSCSEDYQFRRLPFNGVEREVYMGSYHLNFVTKEEILEAKLECWNLMKPE